MRRVRWGLAAIGMTAGLVLLAGPALAGGANWRFDRESYQPGEVAHGATGISWSHNPALGTPDDGPYFVYLIEDDATIDRWPVPPADALRVGVIEITSGPVEEKPGFWVGPHGAKVTFTVPDLPHGRYAVLHCNDPCTKTLADITFGLVTIGSPVGGMATTTTVSPATTGTVSPPDTTTTAPTPPEQDDGGAGLPPVALAGLVAAPLAIVAWRRGRARGRPTASSGA